MARGIHPTILTQEGLEAALCFLAERSPIPVRVEVRLDLRLHQAVEATLDGGLAVHSPAGGGTRLGAEIPCG